MYSKLSYKICDNEILDSEIIQDTESAKRNDPGFDIYLDDRGNCSSLMYAVDHGREELVRYFLSDPNINVNHRNNKGNTALHFCKQVSILKLLLDRRELDVNIQNKWEETGLHLVCYRCKAACVREYLLDARVSTSIRDGWGRTAQNIALKHQCPDIAKIINNSRHTTLIRIPNNLLLYDIVRMIIEGYV